MITLQGCAPIARGRDGDVVGAGGDGAERRLTMGDFISRWQATLRQAFSIPVAFLGVGAYRAWLATFFRFGAYPSMGFGEYAFFEVSIGVVSLLAAAAAGRVAPLWDNGRLLAATGAACVAGSAICVVEQLAVPCAALRMVGLALAGAGLAVLILAWCEFYGALNPIRVAVYHSISIAFGELLIWLMMGMSPDHVMVFSIVLPILSVRWVRRAAMTLPGQDRPRLHRQGAGDALPWKPITLMAACTFATGFGMLPCQPFSMGEVLGVAGSAVFVMLGSLSMSRWFNFDSIYRLAFPFMTAALLLVPSLTGGMPQLSGFSFGAGYTMLTMFVMIVLSNITYRFGVNAVWLNGIERGIRYMAEAAGWCAYIVTADRLGAHAAGVAQLAITLVVMALFLAIVLPERGIGARWGVDLHDRGGRANGGGALADGGVFDVGSLSRRVSELSDSHGLTDREQEILQLIARKVPMGRMERDLFVARGTIKAHTDHIYRKLGVHSRGELYALLGVDDGEGEG